MTPAELREDLLRRFSAASADPDLQWEIVAWLRRLDASSFPSCKSLLRAVELEVRTYDGGRELVAPTRRVLLAALDAAGRAVPRGEPELPSLAVDLLRAVCEAPADDGPRLVFSDWLLERGDPRGAFIQEQIARHAADPTAPPSLAEVRALLRHREAWQAELGPALGVLHPHGLAFRRGFVASGRWADEVDAAALERATGAVAWGTFEALDVGGAAPAELLSHPAMRALEVVSFRALDPFERLQALATPAVRARLVALRGAGGGVELELRRGWDGELSELRVRATWERAADALRAHLRRCSAAHAREVPATGGHRVTQLDVQGLGDPEAWVREHRHLLPSTQRRR